jgi:hypothetical protein
MGDLKEDFMEKIKDDIDLEKTCVLFAPHHGRDSGKVPLSMLKKIDPKIIVIGEAPSQHLNYYRGYNTIKQNSAGTIVFDSNDSEYTDVFVESASYIEGFLEKRPRIKNRPNEYYIGSFKN